MDENPYEPPDAPLEDPPPEPDVRRWIIRAIVAAVVVYGGTQLWWAFLHAVQAAHETADREAARR